MAEFPNKIYLSANSLSEIKQAITAQYSEYLMLKNLQVESTGGGYSTFVSPEFKEYLQLTLHWRGIITSTGKNHTVEKSIRLKNINPQTVTLQQLQTLGNQVISKFNDKNFTTGFVKCKYTKWTDGIQTWGYFDTKETGYKIIEAMGDIVGKPIDKGLFRYEHVLETTEVYDDTPSKIPIAGKQVRPRAKAPVAQMRWYAATITFPWVGHEEQLCNVNGYVLRDLNFLDAYDD